MYRVTISDKNGIPRCWAEGSDVREALEQSVRVTSEYLAMRPDTGPLHVARLDGQQPSKIEQLLAELQTSQEVVAIYIDENAKLQAAVDAHHADYEVASGVCPTCGTVLEREGARR